jgi:hypothetical protein
MVSDIPGGEPAWAEKALEFGWDELNERDIREIKDHLCGMGRLLTGEWQEDRRRILRAKLEEEREQKLLKKTDALAPC